MLSVPTNHTDATSTPAAEFAADRPMLSFYGGNGDSVTSTFDLPNQSGNSTAQAQEGRSLSGCLASPDKQGATTGSGSFAPTPAASAPVLTFAPPDSMLVTDPLSRKLALPHSAIRPTQATSRPGVPSLCLLFLDGRCRQGVQCHQIHAEAAVVLRLREEAKAKPTCCNAHGDLHASRMRPEWLTRSLQFEQVTVPVSALAYSNALERLMTSDNSEVIRCTSQQLCRLHGSERCRFTEDCRFLHLCREVLKTRFADVPDLIPQLELRHKHRASPGSSSTATTTSMGASSPQGYRGSRSGPVMGGSQTSTNGGGSYNASGAAPPQIVVLPDGRIAQVLSGPQPQYQQQQHQPQQQQGGMVMPPHVQMVGPHGFVQQPHHMQQVPMMVQHQHQQQNDGPVFVQLAQPQQFGNASQPPQMWLTSTTGGDSQQHHQHQQQHQQQQQQQHHQHQQQPPQQYSMPQMWQ